MDPGRALALKQTSSQTAGEQKVTTYKLPCSSLCYRANVLIFAISRHNPIRGQGYDQECGPSIKKAPTLPSALRRGSDVSKGQTVLPVFTWIFVSSAQRRNSREQPSLLGRRCLVAIARPLSQRHHHRKAEHDQHRIGHQQLGERIFPGQWSTDTEHGGIQPGLSLIHI